jgi:hypothetical protein
MSPWLGDLSLWRNGLPASRNARRSDLLAARQLRSSLVDLRIDRILARLSDLLNRFNLRM